MITYFKDGNKIASNYDDAKDGDISKLRSSLTKLADNIGHSLGFHIPTGLSNCTLTATQWVDPENPLMRAQTIIDKGRQYGYFEIPEEYIDEGDLVIATNPTNNAHHTMQIQSFSTYPYKHRFLGKEYDIPSGHPLVRYSNGSTHSSGYRENIGLKEYIDNSEGKTKIQYFRFLEPGQIEVLLPTVTVTPKGIFIKGTAQYFSRK